MKKKLLIVLIFWLLGNRFLAQQARYQDRPFLQDRAEQSHLDPSYNIQLYQVAADRNGRISVLANTGLMQPWQGRLVADRLYEPMTGMQLRALLTYRQQFVYLTDKAVLSNAWAGKLYLPHQMGDARCFAGGEDFDFLLGNEQGLQYVSEAGSQWTFRFNEPLALQAIAYDTEMKGFWVLGSQRLYFFDPLRLSIQLKHTGKGYTCLWPAQGGELLLGSETGCRVLNKNSMKSIEHLTQLPWPELTCIREIDGKRWFGSTRGAFVQKPEGGFTYYASRRWLPNDRVRDLAPGPDGSVLVLTEGGLSRIQFEWMTLEQKAAYFERQVRLRHIRYGFNSDGFTMQQPGNLSSGSMLDSDNDGLWTSMYLGSQLFRFAVTGSEEARQHAIESFEAMERLYDINPIRGFPARSFERKGYFKHDPAAWRAAESPQWDWKGTTSSDEAVGHYFACCLMAELIDDESLRQRAIRLIKELTDHILRHNLYLTDLDGQPTRWGRWHPEYVNAFPSRVGDRKLNSSNLIAFLQAAYHFTRDESYKEKAFEMMEKHGYLENLMRPMKEIGKVEAGDPLSKMLSDGWNHSDDEMYFLSYWYLYPYAFNEELREKYRAAIKDHWEIERPEKDALWNFCYAMTGADSIDLQASIWHLQEFPLDLIDWSIHNSHRKDIVLLPANFRNQTTRQVLPPDERPIHKHNTNTFILDRNGGGRKELSGDIFLLPYWMGRYLKLISAGISPER
ncbi:MAG: hypothetical protein D6730_12270 [Bacteroidetes bacterium]|nr:MAG: hypothetical protein D6730_12270 [Bacteroidota bacterium]